MFESTFPTQTTQVLFFYNHNQSQPFWARSVSLLFKPWNPFWALRTKVVGKNPRVQQLDGRCQYHTEGVFCIDSLMLLDSRHSPWACRRCPFQQPLPLGDQLPCLKSNFTVHIVKRFFCCKATILKRPLMVWEIYKCWASNREHSDQGSLRCRRSLCIQWAMLQMVLNALWHYSLHFVDPPHWFYQHRCSRLHSFDIQSWIGGPCSWIRRPRAHPQLYSDIDLHNWAWYMRKIPVIDLVKVLSIKELLH